jgi:uncharacterized membrane protein YhhN
MKKTIYLLYILSAIIFIASHYAKIQIISNITKAIPLIILIFMTKWNSRYNRLIGLGFVFSLAGDIILESFDLFVFGLIAFLIAHVFYIIAFLKKSNKHALISCIPFYSFGIVFFLFLRTSLGEMAIPVALYILIINTMLWRSYVQRNADINAKWALWGALLFTISDSVIALSKFYNPFILSSLIIMLTYWVGQFLIYWSTKSKSQSLS